MSALFPEGVHSLVDLPYALHDAIVGALAFLRYEELPDDERPPKRIWLDADAMREWADDVKAAREAKYSGNAISGSADDNDAAKDLIVG